MARLLVAAVCLALAWGVAAADGKTSKVTIETDPPGAKVYFVAKEDGVICTTPCTVEAPIGETALIIEAENRRSLIENLVVRRRTARPLKLQFKLEPAVGTLVVEGGVGATIKVDEQDVGTAPRRIEDLPAGGHHVALEKGGKQIYDDFVEIEAGGEALVSAPSVVADTSSASRGSGEPAVAAAAPAAQSRRRAPAIAMSAVMSVGFRQFTYDKNLTPSTQRDDREPGQLLAGPSIEVWPTTLLGLAMLPGLALYSRFEYGITPQPVVKHSAVTGMDSPTTLTTAWQSLEVSLHHRWTIANTGTVEVGAGYVDDHYRFEGTAGDVAVVPDARYQSVRIGGRASLLFHAVEPYATVENRIVLKGGAMEHRYALGTSVYGVRGTLGAAARFGHLAVRVEAGLTLYSWTFRYYDTDPLRASGGKDVIESLMLAVGYVH